MEAKINVKKKISNGDKYVFIITDSTGAISGVFRSSARACLQLKRWCADVNGRWVAPTFYTEEDCLPHFVYGQIGEESDVVVSIKKYRVL